MPPKKASGSPKKKSSAQLGADGGGKMGGLTLALKPRGSLVSSVGLDGGGLVQASGITNPEA